MREIASPTYRRVRYLLAREQRRATRTVTPYSQTGVAELVENDQISSVEAGFMQGYLAA